MSLLELVKDAEQDYEWYPTTNEIIDCMARFLKARDCGGGVRFLDIGAGNGKVFSRLREAHGLDYAWYAIEKSQILIGQLPANVFVIGTDFEANTLIDKSMSVIFSNPPYRQFESWTCKIIREAYAEEVYLVIPERWRQSDRIARELNYRNCFYDVLGGFDFLDSEDRKSRARVELVRMRIEYDSEYHSQRHDADPFRKWFKSTFAFANDSNEGESEYRKRERAAQDLHEEAQLVRGPSLIPRLAEMYLRDMNRLWDNYKAIESLDASILKELGVNVDALSEGMKQKISGLKHMYWLELFSNLDVVTSRLTSKSRKTLLDTLHQHAHVDFTEGNAYAIILWVIKNANQYFDSQLTATYRHFSSPDNVRNYVSNQRIITDRWRFAENASHYKLDYRIVWNAYTTFGDRWGDNVNGLHREAANALDDLCVIADNLGFPVATRALNIHWTPGEKRSFLFKRGGVFMEVRPYLNGNVHIKFDQEFLKAFNIEAARILKWIRSAEEAASEMEISHGDAAKYFRRNLTMVPGDIKLLEAGE